jgi:threonine dehydratase
VSESLSTLLGCRVVLKVETVNPVLSFKGRGSDYLMSKINPGTHVVTASAGNLGLAMAYACRHRGQKLTVFAGHSANPLKIERIRRLGAEVVMAGHDFDDAKMAAKQHAAETGRRMVEDSLDVETGEGAGTIGLELARFPTAIDFVLVALGNGALACGTGRYLKHVHPQTRIVAVQARGAPAMLQSWRERRIVRHDSIATIADGIGVRNPIPECVADMDGVIDDGVLVDDSSILEAIRVLHREHGLLVEPSGAASLAALIEHRATYRGATVGILVCGANVTTEQARQWLS